MKHRSGYLHQRGKVYWLEYKINGKRVRESLETTSLKDGKTELHAISPSMTQEYAADLNKAHLSTNTYNKHIRYPSS